MPRGTKFAAEQIIGKLREVELARGKTVPDVVRKLGVTEQTYLPPKAGARRKDRGDSPAHTSFRERHRCALRHGDMYGARFGGSVRISGWRPRRPGLPGA